MAKSNLDELKSVARVVRFAWRAFRGLVRWLLIRPATWLVLGAAWLARQALVGRYRSQLAPLTLAAVLWVPFPHAAWTWAWAAVVVLCSTWGRLPDDVRTARLSVRERHLLADTLALAAVWHAAAPGWPAAARWPAFAALILQGAVPWWRGRRIRHSPPPPELADWDDIVVTRFPQLAGWWTDIDHAARTAVLHLYDGKADDVVTLDADVEAQLRRRPGTVVLSMDPRLTRDCVRVAFPEPETAERYRFWDGPSLDPATGLYIAGYAHGSNKPIYGRLWRSGGACHTAAVGGPGSGKGVFTRVWGLECGLSDQVLLFVVDGKHGAGVPEIAECAVEYATTEAGWERTVDRVTRIMESRERRYGEARKSRFRPGPLEPVIALCVDEGLTVSSSSAQIRTQLTHLTGRGRSLGIHVYVDGQYGVAAMFGSVDSRNNILANGTYWIGQQGDEQGRSQAKQGYPVDWSALPLGPGWAFLGTKVVEHQAFGASRGPFIASQAEVDDDIAAGLEPPPTPFGVCEDWWTKVIHPQLHPDDAAAAEDAGPLAGSPDDALDEAPGADVDEGPRLHAVRSWSSPIPTTPAPRRESGIDKVRRVLTDAAAADPDRELTPKEIARAAGLGERHVRDLLNRLAEEQPPAAVPGDNGWRQAS